MGHQPPPAKDGCWLKRMRPDYVSQSMFNSSTFVRSTMFYTFARSRSITMDTRAAPLRYLEKYTPARQ